MRNPFPLLAVACLAGPALVSAETAYALDSRVNLLRFDTNTPGFVDSSRTIRGLQPGESILGIDFRPANGQLFGLGSTSRLYVIDPATAVATAVGTGPFTPRLDGTEFGFDFNPTVDRIRVVSDRGQNLRLNPDTGGVAATDMTLRYANGRPPRIVASGYTNSVRGATTTMLFGVDSDTRNLVLQNPPNDGVLNVVGMLNVDMSDLTAFDISPTTGMAFLATRVRGSNASVIYMVNLTTASVLLTGIVEGNDQISGLALPAPAQ